MLPRAEGHAGVQPDDNLAVPRLIAPPAGAGGCDLTGRTIGRTADVAAGLKEMYPKASGIIVRQGRFGVTILGEYMPNALEGDYTVAATVSVIL